MMVTVEATGSLRAVVPPGTSVANVETVGRAIEHLSLPCDVGVAMLVNGRVANWNTELQDGDVITLLPAICGGSGSPLGSDTAPAPHFVLAPISMRYTK
jgi:molybdopterin converting factor small subunit